MSDLETLLLLDKPLSALGLEAGTIDFLRDQGIETVADLLDREWVLFPTHIADEVHAAAVRHGLREEHVPEVDAVEQSPAREWSRVMDARERDSYHVYAPQEADLDAAALTRDPRWQTMERLEVEHWGITTYGDDFRPWFEALIEHPPLALCSLAMGGFGDASMLSALGSLADLLAALPALTSVDIIGDMSAQTPLASATLRRLALATLENPERGWDSVFATSSLPALRDFELYADGADAAELTGLTRLASLEAVELTGLMLDAAFLVAIAEADLPLDRLDTGRCWTPFDDPARERALVDALVDHAAYWSGVELILPTDALDFADELASAGLRCLYGD